MSERATSLVLAGALGLGAGFTGLVVAPAVALAATEDGTTTVDAVSDRVTRIADALVGLVGAGTLTQEQADQVATTLAEQLPDRGRGGHGGPGGPGGGRHLDQSTEVLGVSEDELRTALEGGRSLADVAAGKGVEKQELIDQLVAAASAHVDDHLANGDLTQEQAGQRTADLVERVTATVEREGLPARGERPAPAAEEDGTA